jgi:hypothetical protein
VHDEWVHAISLGSDGYSLSFGNESADFRHHCLLVFHDNAHGIKDKQNLAP